MSISDEIVFDFIKLVFVIFAVFVLFVYFCFNIKKLISWFAAVTLSTMTLKYSQHH